MVTEQKE